MILDHAEGLASKDATPLVRMGSRPRHHGARPVVSGAAVAEFENGLSQAVRGTTSCSIILQLP